MNTVTLSITNLDQLQHGVTARHLFDCKGGTIGSGRANWQINDRDQTVAPIHCEIRWIEEGALRESPLQRLIAGAYP